MSREAEAKRGGDSVRGKCVGPWKVFAFRTRLLVEQKTQWEHKHPEDTKELLMIVLYFECNYNFNSIYFLNINCKLILYINFNLVM